MVAKCGGLPLAIVVLGGLAMRKEQSEEEWRKLLKSVSWQLREGEDQISKILALSYHHLPYYMKPCFLYFAMFPEDSLIKARDLMLKWIAEGFIEARGEETMEEVAEEYLEELVHRSLIQVAERNALGGIDTCRIHDLLLDLAISEAKGTNFLFVARTSNNNEGNIITLQKTHRLALHDRESLDIAQQYPTDSTRSLRTVTHFGSPDPWNRNLTSLCDKFLTAIGRHFVLRGVLYDYVDHNHHGLFMSFQIPRILISMKLLRVIDLHNVQIIVPNAIGELIHLRYLYLRLVRSKPLPSSIGELTNLQTLQIHPSIYSTTIELPSEIWKSNLRHLKCVPPVSIKGEPSVNSLSNLQTLSWIKAGKWLYKGLDKMTNLRNLSIDDINNSHGKALSDFLGKLNNLIELRLIAKSPHENEIPTSILTASHHKHLRYVYLHTKLERLPNVNARCLLTNLVQLILEYSLLVEDPLVTLGKLDNLQVLQLWNNAFVGKEMVCLEKGFPQLKELKFSYLESLEEWKIEDEAMPRLRKLVINNCSKLVMLPHGLGRITSLQELEVRGMPSAFTQRLKENDGEDWDKIRHVPSVNIQT